MSRYNTTPTAHNATAAGARAVASDGGNAVTATAIDWVPTVHRNQVPLTPARAGRVAGRVTRHSGRP